MGLLGSQTNFQEGLCTIHSVPCGTEIFLRLVGDQVPIGPPQDRLVVPQEHSWGRALQEPFPPPPAPTESAALAPTLSLGNSLDLMRTLTNDTKKTYLGGNGSRKKWVLDQIRPVSKAKELASQYVFC